MHTSFIYKEINQLCVLLQITYGVAFVGSGLDKFCHLVVDWYAQGIPVVLQSTGLSPESLLYMRGSIEIGIGLLLFTRWVTTGAYAAMIWLILSALYVGLVPGHGDTALRYAVIALGAFALARLIIIKTRLKVL